MESKLRVLVVDDSVTYRKIVSSVLAEMADVDVVGLAANGKIALKKIDQLAPDLLVLDLEMPEMGGLEVLRRVRESGKKLGAIVLSASTAQGVESTVDCLAWGVFDFVLKPGYGSLDENMQRLRRELVPRLAAFARKWEMEAILGELASPPAGTKRAVSPARRTAPAPVLRRAPTAATAEAVAIGISTGGPAALAYLLPRLPADLPVPVLIVQHMPPAFTRSLADDLDRRCRLRVREAVDGQTLRAGEILIAPGGKQMRVDRQAGGISVRITDDPPENSCRPSVDYLFRSLADVYGPACVAVLMTGMGNDGSAACRLLKRRGARIVAQDEASCVVFGMPRQPIEEGLVDVVSPLDRLATVIAQLVERGRSPCS